MMSRPVVLIFLLLILIVTSQFEWKQQIAGELEASPSASEKQQRVLNKEVVKEKIILSQEKSIQRLNELVRSLKLQLLHCGGSNSTGHGTANPLAANVNGNERQQILED